jgi:hypothetical protein
VGYELTSLDGGEPLSPDFRRETISKIVKEISEGRLILRAEQTGRRPEDIELISSTVSQLISYLNDYVSGTKAGEELEFLEKQLFFCLSVLRTYDVLKTNTNESRIEENLRRLESKTDALGLQLAEILKAVDRNRSAPAIETKKKSPTKKSKGRTKKSRPRRS